MPVYEYIAINQKGKSVKGTLDAESLRSARQKLRAKGIYPTDVKEGMEVAEEKSKDIKRYFTSSKVSIGDLAIATRQLATLVGAGLPIVDALGALSDQIESQVLKRIIIDVRESVMEGTSVGKSMAAFPKAFPRLYINMVRSGEASGSLDMVLSNLADYLESQQELRRKVISSLFYPILMLFICTAVVVVLLTFVVPSIVEIFVKQGAVLPLPTRIVLVISGGLTSYWYVIITAIVLCIYLTRAYYQSKKGRANIDRWSMRLPIFGILNLKVNTARISRTLGTLLTNGVGLLEALDIVRNIVGNVHLSQALLDAREGVQEGKSLAKELSSSKLYPPMLTHMIAVGEASGELETMLSKAGEAYENEVNAALAGLTSLIEPLMMVVVGGIVFCIVISILLPMVDLINIVQG